jgi:hypothetical protein
MGHVGLSSSLLGLGFEVQKIPRQLFGSGSVRFLRMYDGTASHCTARHDTISDGVGEGRLLRRGLYIFGLRCTIYYMCIYPFQPESDLALMN